MTPTEVPKQMFEKNRIILNIDGDYREEEINGNKVISVDREVKTEYVTEYVKVEVPVEVPVPSVTEKEETIRKEEQPKQEVQETPNQQKEEAPKNEGGGYSMTVEATAYTNHPSENGGTYGGRVLTKTGYDITNTIYYNGMRVIAVDPSVIPLNSIVEIEGYGKAIALDTGGAIKGNRIDYLVANDSEANNFGRRNVNIKVIGKGQ
ncbi:3D domain-containing protein [Bacillus nitratireducens]|uniref:3D domain-containing protein n=1 Tax=Bacillus nitratireducens TaxID=2026193 RepID=UPI0011A78312